jgi:hypothetical protein
MSCLWQPPMALIRGMRGEGRVRSVPKIEAGSRNALPSHRKPRSDALAGSARRVTSSADADARSTPWRFVPGAARDRYRSSHCDPAQRHARCSRSSHRSCSPAAARRFRCCPPGPNRPMQTWQGPRQRRASWLSRWSPPNRSRQPRISGPQSPIHDVACNADDVMTNDRVMFRHLSSRNGSVSPPSGLKCRPTLGLASARAAREMAQRVPMTPADLGFTRDRPCRCAQRLQPTSAGTPPLQG